jgi:hypothetical protein
MYWSLARDQRASILTCAIGIAGALLGGWLTTLHEFFNLSTWLTAIAGGPGRCGRSLAHPRPARIADRPLPAPP